jgi:alkaline phosphatase D
MFAGTWARRILSTVPSTSIATGMNPHIEFFDSHNWGYSVLEFTPEECTYAAYSVDKTDNSPDADRELLVAYRVPEGVVDLEDVTDGYG